MAAAHAVAEQLSLADGAAAEDARWLVGAGVLGATYCRRGGGGQFACAVCGLAREVTHGGAAARELRRIAGAALVSRLLKWDLEHQTEGGGGGGTAAAWGPAACAAGDVDDVLDGGGGDRLRAVGSLQRAKRSQALAAIGYTQIAAAEAAAASGAADDLVRAHPVDGWAQATG